MSRKKRVASRKSRGKSSLLQALVVLLLCLAALTFYFGYQMVQFLADIQQPDGDFQEEDEEIPPGEKDPEYPRTNILLLGIDARSPREASRADTIMLLSLDNETREASLLSIPRDSRVVIPGRGLDKINHAHAFGGIALTVRTVEEFLEVPIHYYARINFPGFEKIVDSMGGVTIHVEALVARNQPDLSPGLQRLNGAQALLYVRDRSDSDIGRAKRQQKFLKAVARESYSVKNLSRLPQILAGLGENLRTNMPVSEMLHMARLFININLDRIPQGVIPGKSQMIQGVSYWVVDLDQIPGLLQELGIKGS
jgi:polyisoprenyl-teichoic acid--peptidoglycan teichoic acid transferase